MGCASPCISPRNQGDTGGIANTMEALHLPTVQQTSALNAQIPQMQPAQRSAELDAQLMRMFGKKKKEKKDKKMKMKKAKVCTKGKPKRKQMDCDSSSSSS